MTRIDGWTLDPARARDVLCEQLGTTSLAGYGLEQATAAVSAAGGVLTYLKDTQRTDLGHVRDISLHTAADALLIDPVTLRHLNVIEGVGGWPVRLAARRHRPHRDRDGRTAAAPVARPAARDARPHSGSARRGRGLRVSRHRTRQAARGASRPARPGASGRARVARHRRAARRRRPRPVARAHSAHSGVHAGPAGAAHAQPGGRARRRR